jgi:3-oxoacyl-(acyl-carrier-protein) synthase
MRRLRWVARVSLPAWCRPQVDVALSNSFGFGGHNSCILFSGYKP